MYRQTVQLQQRHGHFTFDHVAETLHRARQVATAALRICFDPDYEVSEETAVVYVSPLRLHRLECATALMIALWRDRGSVEYLFEKMCLKTPPVESLPSYSTMFSITADVMNFALNGASAVNFLSYMESREERKVCVRYDVNSRKLRGIQGHPQTS